MRNAGNTSVRFKSEMTFDLLLMYSRTFACANHRVVTRDSSSYHLQYTSQLHFNTPNIIWLTIIMCDPCLKLLLACQQNIVHI